MRMRRYELNENPLDVVRSLIARKSLPTSTSSSDVAGVLFEQLDGRRATAKVEPCEYCGATGTTRVVIPRHGKDPITRCPECGKNIRPGQHTVRGSSNYSGQAGAFYDEGLDEQVKPKKQGFWKSVRTGAKIGAGLGAAGGAISRARTGQEYSRFGAELVGRSPILGRIKGVPLQGVIGATTGAAGGAVTGAGIAALHHALSRIKARRLKRQRKR